MNVFRDLKMYNLKMQISSNQITPLSKLQCIITEADHNTTYFTKQKRLLIEARTTTPDKNLSNDFS